MWESVKGNLLKIPKSPRIFMGVSRYQVAKNALRTLTSPAKGRCDSPIREIKGGGRRPEDIRELDYRTGLLHPCKLTTKPI